jgi:N-methylhydantoinase A/oxoprolinase/acetone carboxylase beta subunit
MNQSKHVRIGIDVGGTFTKAVAVDLTTREIIGKATVPTTHFSTEGVSAGVVHVLHNILKTARIGKNEVELIAHSTTQAVNALLEGDVAKVGIIGMGVGLERSDVVKRTNVKGVRLSGKYMQTFYRFLDTSHFLTEEQVDGTIKELRKDGAEVIVVSEAYGVDDPSNEAFVMKRARVLGLPSTAGHELTGIYGLEIRTLTAAINASILPKSIAVANFVEEALRREGIDAPLMIMKGDGGVTDVNMFRTKPVLTVLSGPAASVAGALLYLKILDGIFIEVGGTSTNLCVIKKGKPEMKYVTIMDHPTCIRSLDVSVVGVAGGSMIRMKRDKIVDVGPRSAHIAGLPYSCFADPDDLRNGEIVLIRPKESDSEDYVAIRSGEKIFAVTNTCAANALGLVTEGDYAHANRDSAKLAIELLAKKVVLSADQTATQILDLAAEKVKRSMDVMTKQYELDNLVLVGGGGGASVLVPYLAKKIGAKHKIAENAEVISSIGVAAAMIHEEIERTLNRPDPNIISELVEEAKQKAMKSGATPESIIVHSEYVAEKGLLRVTAMGNVNLDITGLGSKEVTFEEAKSIAAHVAKISPERIETLFDTVSYYVFKGRVEQKRLFLKSSHDTVVVLDRFGRVRLSVDNGIVFDGSANDVIQKMDTYLRRSVNDGLAPQIHLLNGTKLIDFSGITAPEHVARAVQNELSNTSEVEKVAAIVKLK